MSVITISKIQVESFEFKSISLLELSILAMGNLKSPQSPCVNKIDWQKIARAEVSSFAFVMPLSFIM